MHGEAKFMKYSTAMAEFNARFTGKRVSVIGIGVSNRPLVTLLTEAGAIVTARDKKPREALGDVAAEFEACGVRLVTGEGYLDGIDDEILFRTPGMRYDHPKLREAVEGGAILTSEMQVFFELCPATVIGITGSDGKTTTTTLISEMLKAEGKRVFLGGNIGRPLLPDLTEMTADDYCVIELSSFQLHTMTLSPHIAVITNLSPNHLDYHTDVREYIEAKFNIFLHQKAGDRLVFNHQSRSSLDTILTETVTMSSLPHTYSTFNAYKPKAAPDDVSEEDGMIYCGDTPVLAASDIKIPGRHNIENYMAAIAALWGIVSVESIRKVARTFGGVPHRIELVRTLDGVAYYNSSIDSSPSRTLAALAAFHGKPLILLMGGYDKKLDYTPLGSPLCRLAKAVILTGATKNAIKEAILSSPDYRKGAPEIQLTDSYADSVALAHRMAREGDTVLLSPASASFDAFKNFEERGNFFKSLVNALTEKE